MPEWHSTMGKLRAIVKMFTASFKCRDVVMMPREPRPGLAGCFLYGAVLEHH